MEQIGRNVGTHQRILKAGGGRSGPGPALPKCLPAPAYSGSIQLKCASSNNSKPCLIKLLGGLRRRVVYPNGKIDGSKSGRAGPGPALPLCLPTLARARVNLISCEIILKWRQLWRKSDATLKEIGRNFRANRTQLSSRSHSF